MSELDIHVQQLFKYVNKMYLRFIFSSQQVLTRNYLYYLKFCEDINSPSP